MKKKVCLTIEDMRLLLEERKDVSHLSDDELVNKNPISDFGMDSLDMIEMMMELERTYDFSFPDEKYEKLTGYNLTIGRILSVINNN